MEARFYRFLSSRLIASISGQIFLIYYLWYVVVAYDSVFLVGMIVTISLIVDLLLAYPIGHIIDHTNSTAVNFVGSILYGLGFIIPFLGLGLEGVYIGVAVYTVGYTSKGDSFSAFIKRDVPTDQFQKATSYQQGAAGLSTLVGVVLGGMTIILLDKYLLVILLSFAVSSAILAFPIKEKDIDHKELTTETKEVLKFMRKIAGFLVFGFVINGLFISLEVYSSGIFHIVLRAGPMYYTAFSAALPLGMVIGSALAGLKIERLGQNMSIALMLVGFSPLLIAIGLSRIPLLDVFCAFGIGFLLPLINTPLFVKLTKIVPQEIFGKTMALLRVFVAGSTPVMATIFSMVAAFYAINIVILIVGIIVLPFSIFGLRTVKLLMDMPEAGI